MIAVNDDIRVERHGGIGDRSGCIPITVVFYRDRNTPRERHIRSSLSLRTYDPPAGPLPERELHAIPDLRLHQSC